MKSARIVSQSDLYNWKDIYMFVVDELNKKDLSDLAKECEVALNLKPNEQSYSSKTRDEILEILIQDPYNYCALEILAKISRVNELYDDEYVVLEKMRRLNPCNKDLKITLVECLEHLNRYNEVYDLLHQMIENKFGNKKIIKKYGDCCIKLNKLSTGLKCYLKC